MASEFPYLDSVIFVFHHIHSPLGRLENSLSYPLTTERSGTHLRVRERLFNTVKSLANSTKNYQNR